MRPATFQTIKSELYAETFRELFDKRIECLHRNKVIKLTGKYQDKAPCFFKCFGEIIQYCFEILLTVDEKVTEYNFVNAYMCAFSNGLSVNNFYQGSL